MGPLPLRDTRACSACRRFWCEYHWLTWVVRLLGGAYLIWLGIKLLRAKPQDVDVDPAGRPAGKRAVLFGFLVTLTNPKAIVLFASVFATAVTASTPHWLMGVMIALVTASRCFGTPASACSCPPAR